MPFYEIIQESTDHWHDDDEPMEYTPWEDGMADLYLRAEEAWPRGAAVRDACQAGHGPSFPRDDPGDFDD
jgi:hypothetical protein